MSTKTMSRIKIPVVSNFAKVYRTHRDKIIIIIVGVGDPCENRMLVQFSSPLWSYPLNGRIIEHQVSILRGGKDIDFYNNDIGSHHHSLSGKDGFWRFQLSVMLPGIGTRTAILDDEASCEINTNEFLNCYLMGMQYHLIDE